MIRLAVVTVALALAFVASAQADFSGYWRAVHATCDVSSPDAPADVLASEKRGGESLNWLWLMLQPNDHEVIGLWSLHDQDFSSGDSRLGHEQVYMRVNLSPGGDSFRWNWDESQYLEAELLSPHHMRATVHLEYEYAGHSVTSDCVRHYLYALPPHPVAEARAAALEGALAACTEALEATDQ